MPFPINPDALCNTCATDTTPCSTSNNSQSVLHTNTAPCNPNVNVYNSGAYYPEDYLNPMAGQTLPMQKVFKDQFRGVADFLFDYQEVANLTTGKFDTKLVFKSLPGISTSDKFYDGNFITRGERYHKPTDFYITQNYGAPTGTIQVGFPDGVGGYTPSLGGNYDSTTAFKSGSLQVGDTVRIYRNDPTDPSPDCCVQVYTRTVIAVDPANSTITLEAPATGTFRQGDVIKKLFHSRNDCQEIDNKFGIIASTAKRSYVQHFGYTVDFKKCDLNKAYATPNGAMDFVQNRIFHANLNMVRELLMAVYLGRNRGNICDSNTNLPSETMGIISSIEQANANNPSLRLITSLQNALTDDDKVRHILDVILEIQASGMVQTGETITMLCNQKALAALMKMNTAWNRFTGFTVNTNNNVTKDFTLPVIQTPNGNIEYKVCNILSELYPSEGFIIFMPKNHIALYARPNSTFDYVSNNMVKSTLGLTIKEVTDFKQHECRSFDIFTEMSILIKGLDSGALRIIEGLRPC